MEEITLVIVVGDNFFERELEQWKSLGFYSIESVSNVQH